MTEFHGPSQVGSSSGHRVAIRALSVAALVLVSATSVLAGPGGSQASDATRGIPGFLNPKTGTFSIVPQRAPHLEAGLEAVSTYTGTLLMKFTITIASGVSASSAITCSGSASVFDSGVGPYEYYSETKTVKAVRSGQTATCTVSIPYAWSLSNSDTLVNMSYTVYLNDGTGLVNSRSSSASLANIALPASGATTTKNIAVTL